MQEGEETEPLGIAYAFGDGMALSYPDGSFDFVTAFMLFMDMPKPERALGKASRVLRPGGFVQFSILHPCFAPRYRKVAADRASIDTQGNRPPLFVGDPLPFRHPPDNAIASVFPASTSEG